MIRSWGWGWERLCSCLAPLLGWPEDEAGLGSAGRGAADVGAQGTCLNQYPGPGWGGLSTASHTLGSGPGLPILYLLALPHRESGGRGVGTWD